MSNKELAEVKKKIARQIRGVAKSLTNKTPGEKEKFRQEVISILAKHIIAYSHDQNRMNVVLAITQEVENIK